jgi:hypothetical protein
MIRFSTVIVAVCVCGAALAQPHAGDIVVGRTADNRLKIGGSGTDAGFAVNHTVVELVSQPDGILGPGWFISDPGFDALSGGGPFDPNFQPLSAGAQVYLRAVELDPAIIVFRFEPGIGFVIIDEPGDRLFLGNENLHKHATWGVLAEAPGYVDKNVYLGTFVLDDDSGLHTTSQPFTVRLSYKPPCVGDLTADRETSQADLGELLSVFGLCEDDPGWAWYANIDDTPQNGKQCINQGDLGVLLGDFGCGT